MLCKKAGLIASDKSGIKRQGIAYFTLSSTCINRIPSS